MPTPTKGPRLGAGPAHERLMLANLATALFEHGRITTTRAKARRLRPVAERLITFAKRGDLHARRRVLTVVRDKGVVHTLFTEIGPRFENRPGGYTRITKIGNRKGDNAPMAVIELVEALTVAQEAVGEAERARGTRFASGTPGGAAPAAAGGSTVLAAEPDQAEPDPVEPDQAEPAGQAEQPEQPEPAGASAQQPDQPDQPDVAAEGGDQPAEDATSPQVAGASDTEQAEGEPTNQP